jgi:hypothetical protein
MARAKRHYIHDQVKLHHKKWVDEYLGNEKNIRDGKWTGSIAVGGRGFVDRVKSIYPILYKVNQGMKRISIRTTK